MHGVVVASSLALAALVLAACRGDGELAAKAEREDTRLARRQIDWVRGADFESLRPHISSELLGPGFAAELDRAAAMFPAQEPLAVQLIEHRSQGVADERRVSISFQLRFPADWVAVNVILRQQGEQLLVMITFCAPSILVLIHSIGLYSAAGTCFIAAAWMTIGDAGIPMPGELPPWHDVTETVRAAVKGGRLRIRASNTVFGDPAPGTVKKRHSCLPLLLS